MRAISNITPNWLADPASVPVVLTIAPSEGINAAQRAELNSPPNGAALKLLKRVAFCTDSALVRGAMTALLWLSRARVTLKPFRVSDRDNALDWLAEIAIFDRADVLAELRRMQAHLKDSAVT